VTALEQKAVVALVTYKIVPTIFLAKGLINSGIVFSDNKQIKHFNYKIPIGHVMYVKKMNETKLKNIPVLMTQLENSKFKMLKRRILTMYRKKSILEENSEVY
jgi:ribosomal protein S4